METAIFLLLSIEENMPFSVHISISQLDNAIKYASVRGGVIWYFIFSASQAAILQQTAEYIFSLEQEKTRLLQQNTQLKRFIQVRTGNLFLASIHHKKSILRDVPVDCVYNRRGGCFTLHFNRNTCTHAHVCSYPNSQSCGSCTLQKNMQVQVRFFH